MPRPVTDTSPFGQRKREAQRRYREALRNGTVQHTIRPVEKSDEELDRMALEWLEDLERRAL